MVSFLFADLIILPILNIYRKYYGTKMTLIILGVFYAAMVLAGDVIELVFGWVRLIPADRNADTATTGITWNDTTWLDTVLVAVAVVLSLRFVRTGALPMLKMTGGAPASTGHDDSEAADSVTP